MISLWGASYGLLQPFLLAALLPAVAALIYAYKRKGRGTPVAVASLVILRKISTRSHAKDKFNPPLRFLIELLVLLILVIALAGLYSSKEGDKIAILIDNSFGMTAIAQEGDGTESLFSLATSRAEAAIDSSSADAFFHVYRTSPVLERITPDFVGHAEALESLSSIQAEFAPDNLASALANISERSVYEKILVFSDKQRAIPEGERIGASERIRLYSLTRTEEVGQNIAISHISLTPNSSDNAQASMKVSLHAYTTTPLEVRVSLFRIDLDSQPNEARPSRTTQLTLTPGTAKIVTFEKLSAKDPYRAELSLLSAEEALGFDALALDNFAWISSQSGGDEFLLVGDLPPGRLGLDDIRGKRWSHMLPDAYEQEGSNDRPVLFHRYTPNVLPMKNSLFVLPEEGNSLFPIEKEVQNAEITRWLSSHALTSYLNIPALQLRQATIFAPPAWSQAFISTTSGPVALVGTKEGVNYVALGFEILPFEGKKSPLLSILTLNALKWLASSSQAAGYQSLSTSPAKRADGIRVEYLDTIAGSAERFFPSGRPRIPGIIVEKGPGEAEAITALNFFDSAESDSLKPKTVTFPKLQDTADDSSNRRILYRRLALIAFVLLLLDFLFDLLPMVTAWVNRGRNQVSLGAPHG